MKTGDLQYLAAYWQYVRRHGRILFLGLFLIPLISFFHLLQPLLLKTGIDTAIQTGMQGRLTWIGALWGIVVLFEFLCRALQTYLFQWIGIQTVTSIRADLFQHILHFSSSYFEKTPIGTLVTRITSDIEALNETFASGVVTLVSDLIVLLGILIAMIWLSPSMSLVVLVTLPFLAAIVNFFRVRMRECFNRIRSTLGRLNAILKEQLEGVALVQMLLRVRRNTEYFSTKNREYRNAAMQSVFYDSLLYSIVEALAAVLIGVTLWVGFGLHREGAITLGLLVAFLDYLQKLFQPLKELSSKFATLQGALAALEKIFGAFAIRETIPGGHLDSRSLKGRLSFKNVSFSYPGHEDKPVLKNISLTLDPGEVVAIVGPTGSGKSTIGRLMAHLYAGYEGSIELDGVEIRELQLPALRSRIATVLQDVALFSAPVLFNITLGDPAITREQAREACRLVQMDSWIQALPQGYDSELHGRGRELSLGQAQLLSFARALARDTDIVLLDEATASVDSLSERMIQEAIETIFETRTVLVIAHRLSTVQKADKIIALKDGEIVESGTHEQLMALDGFYAKLFKMQFMHL